MPFVASRRLEDILNPKAAPVAARAMAEKGGQRLMEATKSRTPVDTSYSPLGPSRPRGTARESILRTPAKLRRRVGGPAYVSVVYTEDPIFPYIEWNTRPHRIAPTPEHRARAEAEGRRAMLRFFQNGRLRYAESVMHPGTVGQHPFARAAAFLEAESGHLFTVELEQFAHDLVLPRTGRIIDRIKRDPLQIQDQAIAAWIRAHTVKISGSGRRAVTDLLGGGLGA